MDGVEHDHAVGTTFSRDSRGTCRRRVPSLRQILERRACSCLLLLLDDLLQLGRHRRDRHARAPASRRPAPCRVTMLNVAELARPCRDSPRGSGRRGSPSARSPSARSLRTPSAGCCRSSAVCQPGLYSRLPVDAGARGALLERRQLRRAPAASPTSVRTMPTRSCIISCRSCLDRVRVLALPLPRSNGASASLGRALRPAPSSTAAARVLLRELRRVLAGALAEHEQVGERVAAEPVGAVDARPRTRPRRTGPGSSTSACRRPRGCRP